LRATDRASGDDPPRGDSRFRINLQTFEALKSGVGFLHALLGRLLRRFSRLLGRLNFPQLGGERTTWRRHLQRRAVAESAVGAISGVAVAGDVAGGAVSGVVNTVCAGDVGFAAFVTGVAVAGDGADVICGL